MTTMGMAAIYVRISEDRSGAGEGVLRQEDDCRRKCSELGLDVFAVYRDNDVSAYSGKRRPAFEEMIEAATAGAFSTIVVWATDRLYRRVNDLERLVPLLEKAGVRVVAIKSGDIDLSTADGRLMARLQGTVAQHSSEKMGERISAAYEARARAGKVGGGPRRFGYQADALTPEPTEADLIRTGVETILAGGSLREVCRAWNAAGTAPRGGKWTARTVKQVLVRPWNAGGVVFRGEVVARHSGVAIITEQEWAAVTAILNDPSRKAAKGRGVSRLGSGILICGVCGGPMRSQGKTGGGRIYSCIADGCRKVHRSADFMDAHLDALMTAWLAANAKGLQRPSQTARPSGDAATLRRRLDALAESFADGAMSASAYAKASKLLEAKLAEAEAALSASADPVGALAGPGDPVERYLALTVERRRAVMNRLGLKLVVSPIGAIGSKPTLRGVEVVWGR